MKNIIVLGAGMVGKAMAIDLSKKNNVTVTDIDKNALEGLSKRNNITTGTLDVTKENELTNAIKGFDFVVSAVPGFLGFQTVKKIIENKKDLVDISFLPEDVLQLNDLAKQYNVTVMVDCGVAPGIPNFILGYHNENMEIENFEYMVGGLPKVRNFPFEYKVPFSPCDVIEEYTRPARYVENGKMIVKDAMSDTELVNFEKVGTLEAFNSDGLRSLISTMKNIPNMKEKTLRYPGHIKLVKSLFAAGFFDRKPIKVKDTEVTPFDFTSEILFNDWKLGTEEEEFTILKIQIEGKENGVNKKLIFDMYDEFDQSEKLSSMARTTGFTGTAAAEMILNNVFNEKGVFPPELAGKYSDCYEFVINYLKERKIEIVKKEEVLKSKNI